MYKKITSLIWPTLRVSSIGETAVVNESPPERAMTSKTDALKEVTRLVRELLVVQAEGATAARFASARATLDTTMSSFRRRGLVSDRELLTVVASERQALFGPATQTVSSTVAA